MPASNQPPYTDDQFAKLEARVSNLERKRPIASAGADPLWQLIAGTLLPTKRPTTFKATASLVAQLISSGAVLLNATSTVDITGFAGVNVTTAGGNPISLAAPVKANNYIQLDKTGSTGFPVGNADANTGRIVVQDNAGKMQFAARFPTGAVQVIATEP